MGVANSTRGLNKTSTKVEMQEDLANRICEVKTLPICELRFEAEANTRNKWMWRAHFGNFI